MPKYGLSRKLGFSRDSHVSDVSLAGDSKKIATNSEIRKKVRKKGKRKRKY